MKYILDFDIKILHQCPSRKGGTIEIQISKSVLEKYHIEKVLSTHASSQVYLIRHKNLGQKRILKIISKETFGSSYLYEADILLRLQNPGIPTIYDLEEDEKSFFLIEEYIPGKSLQEQLLYHTFSLREICQIAIQICQIFLYLQNQEEPIVYGDLKLDHIFYQKQQVSLVDFGLAKIETFSEENFPHYKTKGYTAPEVLKSGYTIKSDIYSLASCLMVLYTCNKQGPSIRMERLIKAGLSKNPNRRPSLEAYEKKWEFLLEKQKKKGLGLGGTIYVIGQDQGVGATLFSIAMTTCFKYLGENSLYICRDDIGLVKRMAINDDTFFTKDQLIYHDYFIAMKEEGDLPKDLVRIIDCGQEEVEISHDDIYIFIASPLPYKKATLPKWLQMDNCLIVVNPVNKGAAIQLSKMLGKEVFAYPLDRDPFSITEEKIKIFSKIRKIIYEQEFLC